MFLILGAGVGLAVKARIVPSVAPLFVMIFFSILGGTSNLYMETRKSYTFTIPGAGWQKILALHLIGILDAVFMGLVLSVMCGLIVPLSFSFVVGLTIASLGLSALVNMASALAFTLIPDPFDKQLLSRFMQTIILILGLLPAIGAGNLFLSRDVTLEATLLLTAPLNMLMAGVLLLLVGTRFEGMEAL